MRQLCNVTYAFLVEWMTGDDRARYDRELAAPPGKHASHGTGPLMALLGGGDLG